MAWGIGKSHTTGADTSFHYLAIASDRLRRLKVKLRHAGTNVG